MADYTLYRQITSQLPWRPDGDPWLRIEFCRSEDSTPEHGPMMADRNEAFHVAEWLVTSGLAHKAWVMGALHEPFTKVRYGHEDPLQPYPAYPLQP